MNEIVDIITDIIESTLLNDLVDKAIFKKEVNQPEHRITYTIQDVKMNIFIDGMNITLDDDFVISVYNTMFPKPKLTIISDRIVANIPIEDVERFDLEVI